MEIELQWGMNPIPENAMAAWGARAILKRQCLDLLCDRQSFVQGELSEREKDLFINWINKSGLPKLRKHIVKNHWKNDSEEVFELNEKSYHLRASCRCSYGYCYISAWQEQSGQNQALSGIKKQKLLSDFGAARKCDRAESNKIRTGERKCTDKP